MEPAGRASEPAGKASEPAGRDRARQKSHREKANDIMGGKGEVAIGKRLGKGSEEVGGESSKQIECVKRVKVRLSDKELIEVN